MMYQELRQGEIPCLSFMKNTDYVMYVGPELTPVELSKLHSKDIGVPVIYLPEVVQGISKEMFEYNFPGVAWPGEISADMIYSQIRAELGEHLITPESRMLLKFDGDVLVIFDAKGSFSLAISYLINKCERKPRFRAEEIREGIPDPKLCEKIITYLQEEGELEVVQNDIRFSIGPDSLSDASLPIEPIEYSDYSECRRETSDDSFDEVMDLAAEEVRDAIKQLLLKGFSASVIRSWLDEDIKLSQIRITRQYDIMLVDYDKEVKMGPLPKTVFLFFLRHPEGVRLSYLQDHVDELRRIYGHVSVNDDPQKMEASIAALVDPFNNSICEKCAAVKKAFMRAVNDSIARNYYITGEQGKKKGILLDRNLVEWECEL